ncbi:60S acidic ribosomal protein P0-like [Sinocyclocheilus rhinocerous]|uniref:60S acidic ribosomal protein P0-like n=1 Tax=Sinocyclocheilus rhinocerous TaxID=307959 RepID=UPI0007B84900|nr:PREDICTED: 60S acidic ribosomal protein P0-like [Sinocyclocheilus rhinocerous]
MPREDRVTWKSNYFLKIIQLLDDYPKCFIVEADNVGSKQMQTIRLSLRGKAVVLMGKNTMMRKAIRGHLENNPSLERLLPHIRGNVGFVFTKEDLTEVRDLLLANKVPAAARAGAIAPCEVTVPAQNTGLGPEKTSFFQALGITTKISRGTIEILVSGRNGIQSMVPTDGDAWSQDSSDGHFSAFPGTKSMSDACPPQVKAYLADPTAFAVAAPAASAVEVKSAAPAAKEEAPKEESEESDGDMGFGLFD